MTENCRRGGTKRNNAYGMRHDLKKNGGRGGKPGPDHCRERKREGDRSA